MADTLFDGRKIRSLTIVDIFKRQCLARPVGQSLKGEEVVAVLTRLRQELGMVPERIQGDNGRGFSSRVLDRWAYDQHGRPDCSRRSKPRDNADTESVDGSFQGECLNGHWFLSLTDAQEEMEQWRQEYTGLRPTVACKI